MRQAESGVYTANKCGHDVKTNDCSEARCVNLEVYLPLGAQVVATHCYANITLNAGPDLPHYQFNEVPAGVDTSWSIFDYPVQQSTPTNVVVRTTYHNRSSDRDRDVKLVVDWEP
jgi:hypothetical protein